ncbi:hypothetical protein RvY_12015 [Ramazzottius varieornatus]|uniref:DUF7164 domain-containing protein n=1 Tax=Ramazzottius varieornatus TaxID=947166 RepID=A0A1D1VNG3_RAMVA|nr:hypothetical protein RvY_12015 [Ramazzottius varieornatus]
MKKLVYLISPKRSKSLAIAQGCFLLIVGLLSTIFVMTNNSGYGMTQRIWNSFAGVGGKMAYPYLSLEERVVDLDNKLSDSGSSFGASELDSLGSGCSYDRPELVRAQPLMRAVVVYFSVPQLNVYLDQLKWCMRSLLEMMKNEPPLWRTDMVVYVENITLPHLLDLGCSTTARQNSSEPFRCILVEYIRIENRKLTVNSTEYERDAVTQLKEYPYGESIMPLAENPTAYANYDYVIRTDLDVFFTPAFAKWLPPHCAFISGSGGYGDQYNMQKLAHVANYSGIYFNTTVWNIGSTWIGPPALVAKVAERTVHWMIHLSKVEFSPKMRTMAFWSMAAMWPEWHYGVLSMYGAHLAINEILQLGNKYPFQKTDLDHPTTSQANCTTDGPIHLHTYQSPEYFSKYVFTERRYVGDNALPTVLNSTRCCDYAGYIAADSLNMTSFELAIRLKTAKLALDERNPAIVLGTQF